MCVWAWIKSNWTTGCLFKTNNRQGFYELFLKICLNSLKQFQLHRCASRRKFPGCVSWLDVVHSCWRPQQRLHHEFPWLGVLRTANVCTFISWCLFFYTACSTLWKPGKICVICCVFLHVSFPRWSLELKMCFKSPKHHQFQ